MIYQSKKFNADDPNTFPKEIGKHIVITKTKHYSNKFEAYFNGKSFNVSNQTVVEYLELMSEDIK
jgi:hypothetical protein